MNIIWTYFWSKVLLSKCNLLMYIIYNEFHLLGVNIQKHNITISQYHNITISQYHSGTIMSSNNYYYYSLWYNSNSFNWILPWPTWPSEYGDPEALGCNASCSWISVSQTYSMWINNWTLIHMFVRWILGRH